MNLRKGQGELHEGAHIQGAQSLVAARWPFSPIDKIHREWIRLGGVLGPLKATVRARTRVTSITPPMLFAPGGGVK